MITINIIEGKTGKIFEKGYQIARDKGVAIIGISPGNSYYEEQTIYDTISRCSEIFSQVKIWIPSSPAIHTYNAIGYLDGKAESKARLSSNLIVNRVRRSLARLKMKEDCLMDWLTDIDPREEYKIGVEEALELYNTNKSFRLNVRNSTKKVIENKLKLGRDLEEAIDNGVLYQLEEFGSIKASPEIVGAKEATVVYHQDWPLLREYLNGTYGNIPTQNIGFTIMNNE